MVLLDLLKVQSDCSFCIANCVSGDEMCTLSDTVNDYHDCIIAMHLRKFNNEVDTDDIPLIFWNLCRVKVSVRSTVLQLGPIA
jgi:hypothetical protein